MKRILKPIIYANIFIICFICTFILSLYYLICRVLQLILQLNSTLYETLVQLFFLLLCYKYHQNYKIFKFQMIRHLILKRQRPHFILYIICYNLVSHQSHLP